MLVFIFLRPLAETPPGPNQRQSAGTGLWSAQPGTVSLPFLSSALGKLVGDSAPGDSSQHCYFAVPGTQMGVAGDAPEEEEA